MSKPYTESDLSDLLDAELVWRRKELADLKAAIADAKQTSRPALIRALVTMTYAHWEGYIRSASNRYFEHITLKRRSYAELDRQYYVNTFLVRLQALFSSKSNVAQGCELIENILDQGATKFAYINPALIDTRSNLNTDVIVDICRICGVDSAYFVQKSTYIDVILLKRRNAIAHGQVEPIDESEADTLVSEALALMAHFRSLLENRVYTKQYLRPATAA